MTRLVVLPLDDRPVNYDHPWWLGQAAGIDVRRPPREWLGNPFRSAERSKLSNWLIEEGQCADGLAVAVDTLGYGGLIPSRQSYAALAEVVDSLDALHRLRAMRPDLMILAISILMRVNRSNSAEEEKPYWAEYGPDVFRLSYLDDKASNGCAAQTELEELRRLRESVPPHLVDDYQAGRARNHSINRLMVEWAGSGVLTYVVIAQDDTAAYGWNIAESRALRTLIRDRGLSSRATVYPGADEVSSLLVAAFACRTKGFRPRAWTHYSRPNGPSVVTAYEDRPLQDLVKAHLGPLDGELAESPDDADLVVAIHAPNDKQTDARLQTRTPIEKDLVAFAGRVADDCAAGRNVAVVDVEFVNGADVVLAEQLLARAPIAQLAAYAAWNTAGNSLGSALAQAAVRTLTRKEDQRPDVLASHIALLAIHFMDDYFYQSVVRTQVMLEDLPALGLEPTFQRLPDEVLPEVERRIGRRMQPHVLELARKLQGVVASLEIDAPSLPWGRVFEIAITPRIALM